MFCFPSFGRPQVGISGISRLWPRLQRRASESHGKTWTGNSSRSAPVESLESLEPHLSKSPDFWSWARADGRCFGALVLLFCPSADRRMLTMLTMLTMTAGSPMDPQARCLTELFQLFRPLRSVSFSPCISYDFDKVFGRKFLITCCFLSGEGDPYGHGEAFEGDSGQLCDQRPRSGWLAKMGSFKVTPSARNFSSSSCCGRLWLKIGFTCKMDGIILRV